jgi:hypothetical protein
MAGRYSKMKKGGSKARLGTGKRFAALKKKIKSGLKSSQLRPGQTKEEAAAAISAFVGRKKWGKRRFQKLASVGRKRAARRKA